jgi:hypothetical protein
MWQQHVTGLWQQRMCVLLCAVWGHKCRLCAACAAAARAVCPELCSMCVLCLIAEQAAPMRLARAALACAVCEQHARMCVPAVGQLASTPHAAGAFVVVLAGCWLASVYGAHHKPCTRQGAWVLNVHQGLFTRVLGSVQCAGERWHGVDCCIAAVVRWHCSILGTCVSPHCRCACQQAARSSCRPCLSGAVWCRLTPVLPRRYVPGCSAW